jgi:hypothetical protein
MFVGWATAHAPIFMIGTVVRAVARRRAARWRATTRVGVPNPNGRAGVVAHPKTEAP